MEARRRWSLAFAFWTGLALFFTTQIFLDHAYSGHPLTWGQALSWALVQWYAWGALAPAIAWLASRFAFEHGRVARALAVHAAAGLGTSIAKTALDLWVAQRVVGLSGRSVSAVQFHLNVLTYAAIVGAAHGAVAIRRSREREVRASQAEAALARSELHALRMQLQPHFLFNTLHAISSLVREDPDAAERTIARLSDLLRLTLQTANADEVTLKDELEVVDRYVEIQQVRFSDRLAVSREIDPAALDALVPSLLLQPLVENAIRHGVAPRAEGGRVEICARRDGSRVRLEIRDDGPGLPPAHCEGLGLSNTRARLRHLYGDDHALVLERGGGGRGLVASVTIPWRTRRAS